MKILRKKGKKCIKVFFFNVSEVQFRSFKNYWVFYYVYLFGKAISVGEKVVRLYFFY